MPTTYDVFYLGQTGNRIDEVEGNAASENAAVLLGQTFGSDRNPLFRNIQSMPPVGSPGTVYDTDNNAVNDQFSVDGTTYTIDGFVV